jgi:hypothetical protein
LRDGDLLNLRYLTEVANFPVLQRSVDESPRAGRLVAIALICFAIGFALGRFAIPTGHSRRISARPSIRVESITATSRDRVEQPPLVRYLKAPSAKTSEPSASKPAPTNLKFEPGRVAYLRCDGMIQATGSHPCPRDVALESAVWQQLEQLPTCQVANPGIGYAELRLDFKRAKPASLRILLPTIERPVLKRKPLYECVGESLTSLKTALDPIHMIVSFQFRFRSGDK